MLNTLEVVHTIAISDILRTTEHIHNRCMDLLQLFLRRHRHAANSLIGILLVEESAIADHEGRNTWVGTVEQGLQTATRHAGYTDMLGVNLLIIRRFRIAVLGDNPINALNLLLCTRHRTSIGLLIHRDDTRSQHDEAVRSNLVQEIHVFPRRVRAGTITPYQNGQRILGIERLQVLRHENGMF